MRLEQIILIVLKTSDQLSLLSINISQTKKYCSEIERKLELCTTVSSISNTSSKSDITEPTFCPLLTPLVTDDITSKNFHIKKQSIPEVIHEETQPIDITESTDDEVFPLLTPLVKNNIEKFPDVEYSDHY